MLTYEVEVEVTGDWNDFEVFTVEAASETEAEAEAERLALDFHWPHGYAHSAEVLSIEEVANEDDEDSSVAE